MTNQVALRSGALELRSLYPIYAIRGLAFATILHLVLIGGYYFATAFEREDSATPTVTLTIHNIPQPPSIKNTTVPPAVTIAKPYAEAARANPIMFPDAEVNPNNTVATQNDMNPEPLGTNGDVGANGNVVYDVPAAIESEAEPPPFEAVEKSPEPIVNPSPHYPEMALRAGIEGTVSVRAWVTKEGKVKRVEVVKSDSELLSQAAIDAAMQWIFTPAIMNNGPVSVWMSIPFKFRIRNGR